MIDDTKHLDQLKFYRFSCEILICLDLQGRDLAFISFVKVE